MGVTVDTATIQTKVSEELFHIGDIGIEMLAKLLVSEAKSRAPLLSAYGSENKRLMPHEYKANRGEIKQSIKPVKSKKYQHSWLVNVQDWRAHFVEYGTKPHSAKAKKTRKAGRGVMGFLGTHGYQAQRSDGLVFRGQVHNPGMKGVKFLEETSKESVVNGCVDQVISKLGNNPTK